MARTIIKLFVILIMTKAISMPWQQYPDYLFFVIPNSFGNLDPNYTSNAQTKFSLSMVYEHLVNVDTHQRLAPALAQSWQIDLENNTIILDISRDHYFSDGNQVTVDDVITSLTRFCSHNSESSHELKGLVGCYSDAAETHKTKPHIKALNDYQVQLEINISPTMFLYQLAAARAVILREVNGKLIGSGPYKILESSEKYVIFENNPYYHAKNTVKNTGIIIYHVERKQLKEFLEQEKPDGTLMDLISDISHIENNNYHIESDPMYMTHIFIPNNQRFPFNNKIVRQALAATIYNESGIDTCFPNVKKAYGIIPIGLGGSIANTAPDKLTEITPKEVFKQVPTLENSLFPVIIHLQGERKNQCEEQKLVDAAKKYNIAITFQYHDDYATLIPLYLSHDLDGFVEFFNFTNREAYSVLQFFIPSSQENFANVHDSRIDELFNSALKALSSRGRFKAYRELNTYLQSESIILPYYYVGTSNLVSKCLEGLPDKSWFNPFIYIPYKYRQDGCALQ